MTTTRKRSPAATAKIQAFRKKAKKARPKPKTLRQRAKASKSKAPTRDQVWASLWKDPRYLRIQETKDRVLKEWNHLDAWKHTRSGQPEKLRMANRRVARILALLSAYETRAFAKHGFRS